MIPLIGIVACVRDLNGTPMHATPTRYAEAVRHGVGGLAVLIPPQGEAVLPVLDALHGVMLSGSPSNVDPALYGAAEDLTPELHDRARDDTALPLIRAALARGLPVLGICRGLQEMNVALGGTLHQAVHDLAGRDDHRGGPGETAHRYRMKHTVELRGGLAALMAASSITVNSVHGQAIDRVADGLEVEAVAADGTIEAVRVRDAAFAYGVQWHPEWRHAADAPSTALLRAFGDACRARAAGRMAA